MKDNQTIHTQHDIELQHPFVISTGRTGVVRIHVCIYSYISI